MVLCMIGATEIIIICALVLLLFGGKKIPELMKGVGQGVRSFKEGMREITEDKPQSHREEQHNSQQEDNAK